MSIGKKLDELIRLRKRNVNDVSISSGVSASTIYSIIRRNNTNIDLDNLQALADELCVTLDYFVSDEVKNKPLPETETELDAAIQETGLIAVDIFNQLSPEKQKAALDILKILSTL